MIQLKSSNVMKCIVC